MATKYLPYPEAKKQVIDPSALYSSKLRQGLVAHKGVQADCRYNCRCIGDYRPSPTDKIITSRVKITRHPNTTIDISMQTESDRTSITGNRRPSVQEDIVARAAINAGIQGIDNEMTYGDRDFNIDNYFGNMPVLLNQVSPLPPTPDSRRQIDTPRRNINEYNKSIRSPESERLAPNPKK